MLRQSLVTMNHAEIRPSGADQKELSLLLAQTAWGEAIIQPALEKLRAYFSQGPVLRIIDSQLHDEKRHEALYWKRVRALDPHFPQNDLPSYYRHLLALAESCDSPQELLVILHVCLESFAMGAFEYRHSVCLDGTTLAIDAEVEVDERRHLEFGPLLAACLRETHKAVPREHLMNLVRQVHEIFTCDGIVSQLQQRLGSPCTPNRTSVQTYREACNRIWMQKFKQFMRAAYEKDGP